MSSKTWKRVAIEAVATTRVRGAPEKGEIGFERGAELELFAERRGWYKGYVLPDRKHGIIPGKALHITVEHDELDIEPPAENEPEEEREAAPVKAVATKKTAAVAAPAKKPAPLASFDDLLDELADDPPPPISSKPTKQVVAAKKPAAKMAPPPVVRLSAWCAACGARETYCCTV